MTVGPPEQDNRTYDVNVTDSQGATNSPMNATNSRMGSIAQE